MFVNEAAYSHNDPEGIESVAIGYLAIMSFAVETCWLVTTFTK